MEINVEKIIYENIIQVSYKYGTFIGKWMNENIPNNGNYYIEIDYNEIINYKIISDKKYNINNDYGKNIISGLIIYEDNYEKYLDFGGDGYIDVDRQIVGNGILIITIKEKNIQNKFMEIEIVEIQLWPFN